MPDNHRILGDWADRDLDSVWNQKDRQRLCLHNDLIWDLILLLIWIIDLSRSVR